MKTTYLISSAMLLALAAPAYADPVSSNITQTTGTGSTYLGTYPDSVVPVNSNIPAANGNVAAVSGAGPTVTSIAGQTNNNVLNAVGQQGSVGVGSSFSVMQGAGTFQIGGAPDPTIGTVTMNANNSISAASTSALLSNVTAGGNQTAGNVLNLANIAPANGAAGSISQAAGNTTQTATNSMSATATNGQATVTGVGAGTNGQSGFQSAYGSLNTAGVFLAGAPATTGNNPTPAVVGTASVDLSQQLKNTNTIGATNIATANTSNGTSTTIDPTVSNLAQSSSVAVNQAGFATAAGTTSVATLTGSQDGTYHQLPVGTPTTTTALAVTLGNGAVAYTGTNTTGGQPNNVNANGVGATTVSGVTQNTSFALNGVNAGTGVSLALGSNDAPTFTQTVDGSQQTISGNNPLLDGAPSNGLLSSTGSGSASISGVTRTAATDPFTQAYSNQQNTIAAGGSLSGTATQSATNFDTANTPVNVAVSLTGKGAASVSNVSQNMTQNLNSAQSGSSSNLTLGQTAGGADVPVVLANANVQYAGGTGSSSITGAGQVSSTNANVASLGTGSTNLALTQAGTGVTLGGVNALYAVSGPSSNTTVSGAQVGNSSLNVASVGSMSGSITQTSTGAILSNANLMGAANAYNASVSGSQTVSNSVNVIK